MQYSDRTIAYVDLDRIEANYELMRQSVGPKTEVMAVVKANAYGHGAVETARHLETAGCHYFGVASLAEAIELRDAGIHGEILIFGHTFPEHAYLLEKHGLIQTVTAFSQAEAYEKSGWKVKMHVNVDTGMSRYGMSCHNPDELDKAISEIEQISRLHNCRIEGIYTHFAIAEDTDNDFTKRQFRQFQALLTELDKQSIKVGIRHCCNSSAALLYPEMHLDMVRTGIAIYGLPHVKTDKPFVPALTLKAKVAATRWIKAGETVSYGRTFAALNDMEVATLALGYAEGYSRHLSNLDHVLYEGKTLPVIGVVCMDAVMIDATGCDLQIGDMVEVFGQEKTAADVAKLAGTIDYEVLTNLSQRVERVYLSRSGSHE